MTHQAADDRLDEAIRAYARSLPGLPASVDDRVMDAVRGRAVPARPRRLPNAWRWLIEPQRVRPAWGVALAAAASLAVWVVARRTVPVAVPVPAVAGAPAAPAAPVADTIFVRFELTAPAARQVTLAGSFNGWSDQAITLTRGASGTWSVTVPLPVGEHRYQFVVDGARWVPDPTAHAQIADGFGGTNSVIVVGPKGVVRT
jgi:hypothetical protein